ncbi:MAG: hypothetical protein IPM29_02030 [Planctomycetes bacterium]|nr:hypothetical protein [Planctomycetota bacterium]
MTTRPERATWPLLAAVPLAAGFAVVWPLATYAITLGCCGAPHALAELRYVDRRFGARLGGGVGLALATLLAGVALLRLAALAGVDLGVDALGLARPGLGGAVLELLALGALSAVALPRLGLGPGGALAAVVAAALTLAALRWPLPTLAVLAILHNVTPVGFLAERLRGRARRRALLACVVAFGAVPLWIASGQPASWLAARPDALPAIGDVADHLGAFLPASVHTEHWALDVFRAAAFLQCMHYVAVLGVLPRLDHGDAPLRPLLPWPPARVFAGLLVALALVSAAAFFAWSFRDARRGYAVLAVVHAWVEFPVLLLGLVAAAPRSGCAAAPSA